MSYEPRGKMINLVAAIQAEPRRFFKANEVAEILCCKNFPSTINQYVYAAVIAGVIHKRQAGGDWYYRGSPITDEDLDKAGIARPANWSDGPRAIRAPAYSPEEIAAAKADARAPKEDPTWKPPQMTPPRGTSAPVPSLAPTASPERPARLDAALSFVPTPIATRAPEPEPVVSDASTTEQAGAEVDEAPAEEIEPDAFVSCRTGEIVIVGIDPDEEGRITLPADLVQLIKRQIAWSPAP